MFKTTIAIAFFSLCLIIPAISQEMNRQIDFGINFGLSAPTLILKGDNVIDGESQISDGANIEFTIFRPLKNKFALRSSIGFSTNANFLNSKFSVTEFGQTREINLISWVYNQKIYTSVAPAIVFDPHKKVSLVAYLGLNFGMNINNYIREFPDLVIPYTQPNVGIEPGFDLKISLKNAGFVLNNSFAFWDKNPTINRYYPKFQYNIYNIRFGVFYRI